MRPARTRGGSRRVGTEQRKYALTLAALELVALLVGFEPGCSIGVLLSRYMDPQSAQRCDCLLAATSSTPR